MSRTGAKQRPRRISLVGATGSGKTRLSRILSDRLNIPVYELDSLRRDSDPAEFRRAVASIVARSEWIIDGHYRDVRYIIWKRADTVLWLNYPLPLIARHLLRRFRRKSHSREGAGDAQLAIKRQSAGNSKATWGQRLRRIARTLRERREYGRLLGSGEYDQAATVELTSPEAATAWLNGHSRC